LLAATVGVVQVRTTRGIGWAFWSSLRKPAGSKGEKADAELNQLPHHFVSVRVFSWLQEKSWNHEKH
jgi:hypothetical protein